MQFTCSTVFRHDSAGRGGMKTVSKDKNQQGYASARKPGQASRNLQEALNRQRRAEANRASRNSSSRKAKG